MSVVFELDVSQSFVFTAFIRMVISRMGSMRQGGLVMLLDEEMVICTKIIIECPLEIDGIIWKWI